MSRPNPPCPGPLGIALEPPVVVAVKTDHQIYDALVSRIADECPDSGFSEDMDLISRARPTNDEFAATCNLFPADVGNYVALDMELVARALRGQITAQELQAHVFEATRAAVVEAKLHLSVIAECDRRADDAAIMARESPESFFGVAGLFA